MLLILDHKKKGEGLDVASHRFLGEAPKGYFADRHFSVHALGRDLDLVLKRGTGHR
jgi:hypothetical protein